MKTNSHPSRKPSPLIADARQRAQAAYAASRRTLAGHRAFRAEARSQARSTLAEAKALRQAADAARSARMSPVAQKAAA